MKPIASVVSGFDLCWVFVTALQFSSGVASSRRFTSTFVRSHSSHVFSALKTAGGPSHLHLLQLLSTSLRHLTSGDGALFCLGRTILESIDNLLG